MWWFIYSLQYLFVVGLEGKSYHWMIAIGENLWQETMASSPDEDRLQLYSALSSLFKSLTSCLTNFTLILIMGPHLFLNYLF